MLLLAFTNKITYYILYYIQHHAHVLIFLANLINFPLYMATPPLVFTSFVFTSIFLAPLPSKSHHTLFPPILSLSFTSLPSYLSLPFLPPSLSPSLPLSFSLPLSLPPSFLLSLPPSFSPINPQADRFQSTYSITPGPGTYVVSKESDWLRKTYPPHRQTEVHIHTVH